MSSCTNAIAAFNNLFALQPTKGKTKPCPHFSSFFNLLSPKIRAAGVFSEKLISPVVLFPGIFSIRQEHLFSRPSVRVCYLFIFFLTAMCQTRIYLFVSSKIQTYCTSYLQTGTCNLSDYSECFPGISPHCFRTQKQLSRGVS